MDPCFRRDDGEGGSCNFGYMTPCVYILASGRNGTLYIGVTSNLPQRVWQHREGFLGGFTRRYGIKTLVYYERHDTMESAIRREKQMKLWKRNWKIELIECASPDWLDLYEQIAL
ncbi:putative endonuclease [Kaistia defluvii]|uniref:Endonuclease n=2 Tax=Kaistia defluvii TaxID=410841 RepID=A0ABV2R345_9HYPH